MASVKKLDEKAIFNIARKIKSSEARTEYLHQACGADENLFERVNTLLGAYEEQASFLESPAAGGGTPTIDHIPLEGTGTQIGPYKLLQEIGEGGMGVVYMAEQHEPVKRRVALKLIKPGMDTRQFVARFEAERQALAIMDHPNIARVLDCGTTSAGHPYFVMELVKGVPITRYCDDNHLTPRDRLELFVPICQAIQHAHQKGIIHRDIKPSNILIAEYDHKAVPKIIDFGVAKALNQQLTDKTMFTGLGQVVGSIEYMSPEQARVNQLDVDTRSDIYSLGVLLYELLTGVTPFDRKRLLAAALDELLRIIREEEPPRPSTRLSTIDTLPSVAANRHIEPRKLSALLHGELDWIVMKALEKDRARRYETANGFANDIQRYLNDEAVQACPPSAKYRFGKFARRNKVAITTGSLVAAALVIGIIGTTWQSIRASDQAARAISAEQLADQRYESEKLARQETESARQQEKAQRQLAEQARADTEIARQTAVKARDEAQTEATRANHVVKVLKSIFSSQDSRSQSAVPTNYTVAQLFTDFADRLPKELSKEPAVEAEIRSIIGRALSRNDRWGSYPHFAEAQRLRESIYPPDHPIHIETLFDLLDYYNYLCNYSKANQIADQILPRARALDGNEDLKLRAYAAWMQRNENSLEIFDLGSEALEIANANNENNNPAAIQINRVLISRRFTELIQDAYRPPDFDDQLGAIESAAEQLLATCENALGKQHAETVPILRLLAKIKRVQGKNEAVKDLLIRAFKTNLDHSIFYEPMNHIGELRGLDLPESEFKQLIDRDPWFSDFYYRIEAINRLYNNDIAGYRSLIKKLLQRNASRGAEGLAAVALAAFISDSATDDWTVLRDLALSSIDPEDPDTRFVGILYRSNDLHKAIEFMEKTDQVNEFRSIPGYETSYHQIYRWYNWLFLSMSHHRLGNRQQSRKYFIRAATQIPRLLKYHEFGVGRWHHQILSLLYREAFKTIEFDPDEWIVDPTDKMELVGRAELYLLNDQKQKALLDYSAAIELDPQNIKMRLWRAEFFTSEGRFPEAIADYTKAIELDPNNADLKMGNRFFNMQHFDGAIQVLSQIPNDPEALLLRGHAYCRLGNVDKAIADYQRAAELEPQNTRYALARLSAMVGSGQAAASQAELDQLLQQSADPGRLLGHYGFDLICAGWLEQMESAVARAVGTDVESLMHYNLGCSYAIAGNKDQAFVALNRSIELGESRAHMFAKDLDLISLRDDARFGELLAKLKWSESFEQGRAKYQAKNFSEAIEDFTQAAELNPKYGELWHWRGLAYRANGQTAEADADYQRYLDELNQTLAAQPDNWQAVNRRGVALYETRHWDEAIADFDRVIELAPDTSVLYHNRAVCFFEQQQWTQAANDLARAIELGGAAWQVHYHLALARLGDGDATGYREVCRGMLAAFAETLNPLIANFVAWTCTLAPDALEDWQPALKMARMAESQSQSLQNQNTLGTLLMRAGQTDEAIKVLSSVAEQLDKPDASANASPAYTWYALALACDDAGQAEQARQWRDKADAWTAQLLDEPSATDAATVAWNRRLTLELLRNEVKNKFNTDTKSTTEKVK